MGYFLKRIHSIFAIDSNTPGLNFRFNFIFMDKLFSDNKSINWKLQLRSRSIVLSFRSRFLNLSVFVALLAPFWQKAIILIIDSIDTVWIIYVQIIIRPNKILELKSELESCQDNFFKNWSSWTKIELCYKKWYKHLHVNKFCDTIITLLMLHRCDAPFNTNDCYMGSLYMYFWKYRNNYGDQILQQLPHNIIRQHPTSFFVGRRALTPNSVFCLLYETKKKKKRAEEIIYHNISSCAKKMGYGFLL